MPLDDLAESIFTHMLGPATSGIRLQIANSYESRGNVPIDYEKHITVPGLPRDPSTIWIGTSHPFSSSEASPLRLINAHLR
jgi:hypothetical protein